MRPRLVIGLCVGVHSAKGAQTRGWTCCLLEKMYCTSSSNYVNGCGKKKIPDEDLRS